MKYLSKGFSVAWIASLLCEGSTYEGIHKIMMDLRDINEWIPYLLTCFALFVLLGFFEEDIK